MKAIANHRRRVCRECQAKCEAYLGGNIDHADPLQVCHVGRWNKVVAPPFTGKPAAQYAPNMQAQFQQKSLMQIVGPARWETLHGRPKAVQSPAEERAWLVGPFTDSLPCGTCRGHFLAFLKSTPPIFNSKEDYFAWTVACHNYVNRLLERKAWTLEEAKARWPLLQPNTPVFPG